MINKIIQRFEMVGKKWVLCSSETSAIDMQHYNNIIGAKSFMRNLGGYERHTRSYTCNGYIVTHINSISPDKQNKTTYDFDFITGGTN